jgi:AraC-like DNA-binding protein
MDTRLLQIAEPTDYFKGAGTLQLPTPIHILLFLRKTKNRLQQHANQNRSHHRFILIFNLATKGFVHVDNLTLPFAPGQALLILPYQFHHFSHLEFSKLQWLFCSFELKSRSFLEPLRNRTVDTGASTQQRLTDLLRQWHQPSSELRAWQLQTALLHLLVSLKADLQKAETAYSPETENNLLWTVHRLMSESRGHPVTVAELAQAMKWSSSRLRVLFKEAAGIPLGRYIQNYRLNHAMSLLRTTNMPIAAIAENSGFGSPQAFSRVFKKETGKSPRTYRQEG